jgi:hypothetical protein
LSCYLAYDISYALTQSNEARGHTYELFKEALKLAKNASATENPAPIMGADDFLEARQGGGGFVRDPMT